MIYNTKDKATQHCAVIVKGFEKYNPKDKLSGFKQVLISDIYQDESYLKAFLIVELVKHAKNSIIGAEDVAQLIAGLKYAKIFLLAEWVDDIALCDVLMGDLYAIINDYPMAIDSYKVAASQITSVQDKIDVLVRIGECSMIECLDDDVIDSFYQRASQLAVSEEAKAKIFLSRGVHCLKYGDIHDASDLANCLSAEFFKLAVNQYSDIRDKVECYLAVGDHYTDVSGLADIGVIAGYRGAIIEYKKAINSAPTDLDWSKEIIEECQYKIECCQEALLSINVNDEATPKSPGWVDREENRRSKMEENQSLER